MYWTDETKDQTINDILMRPYPWQEADTNRLDKINVVKFWRLLTGHKKMDVDYWLTRIENELILGRDPDYAISEETTNFGDSFSILINSHISRVEKLNLIPLRGGKYPTTTKVDGGTANLLG